MIESNYLENECTVKKMFENILNKLHNYLSRCGALSIGDQILSIDDTIIENTTYTPEDVMSFLNGPSDRGFTQLQILPVHAIQRKGLLIFFFSICFLVQCCLFQTKLRRNHKQIRDKSNMK